MIRFEGSQLFRARLVGSILSNKPVLINKIRQDEEVPGVTDYEVNFCQLIDSLTNGSTITINSTGTTVAIKPGYIIGGRIEHDCVGRSIGYYLESIIPMCLFSKRPVHLTLTGITNDDVDICVDTIKNITTKFVARFGLESRPDLQIIQRGLVPNGKGKVVFTCPVVKELKAIQLTDPGLIENIRGVAYGVRVNPQFTNRIATTIRGMFNQVITDVYINTDHIKGSELIEDLTAAPGYGVCIFAESTTRCVFGAKRNAIRQSVIEKSQQDFEATARLGKGSRWESAFLPAAHPNVASISDPEGLGGNVAGQLLHEVDGFGCVDTSHQPLAFMLMALCPEDVSKIRVGRLSRYSVHFLRLLESLFGVVFRLKADEENDSVVCSCVGVGYKNLARKVT